MKTFFTWISSTLFGALTAYLMGCSIVFGWIEKSSTGMFGGTHFILAAFITIPAYFVTTIFLLTAVSDRWIWRRNALHSFRLQPLQCLLVLLLIYTAVRVMIT